MWLEDKVAGRSLNLTICMLRGPTCILQQIIDYESEHSGWKKIKNENRNVEQILIASCKNQHN